MSTEISTEQQIHQLQQHVGRLSAEAARNAQERIYTTLSREAPGWEKINESESFLKWLAVPNDITGASRHDGLTDAFRRGDAARVLAIFRQYEHEQTALFEGRPRAAAAANSSRKVWTEREIKDFYERARRKQVKPDEYQRVSAELAAAAREGRIRPDRIDPNV